MDASENPCFMPRTAFLAVSGCEVATDIDLPAADVEVYQCDHRAALQIATCESFWVIAAARPPCVIETVDAELTLSIGDAFMLPAGMPALVHGRVRGEWVAVRLARRAERLFMGRADGRRMHLAYGEALPLARVAFELADCLRNPAAPFARAREPQLVRRLLCEIDALQSARLDGLVGLVDTNTTAPSDDCLERLLRVRFSAEHGYGLDSALDLICAGSTLSRVQLLATYERCFGPQSTRPRQPALAPAPTKAAMRESEAAATHASAPCFAEGMPL